MAYEQILGKVSSYIMTHEDTELDRFYLIQYPRDSTAAQCSTDYKNATIIGVPAYRVIRGSIVKHPLVLPDVSHPITFWK